MLDPQLLRNELETVATALKKRGFELDVDAIQSLEARRKTLQIETEQLQALRNAKSKEHGKIIGGTVAPDIKVNLKDMEKHLKIITGKLNDLIAPLPNIPHDSVPIGQTEADNEEIRQWGKLPVFDFAPKDHVALGESLGLIDFERATKISGARFVVMQGAIARLHRALIQFMLDIHTNEHGYREINVPYLVNEESCFGTGQLPKFEQDLFHVAKQGFYLIPSSEVPVTNLVRNEIVKNDELPMRYVCHSPCFRSEAGSYGKDTRGMIRQHQFEKVELVQLVKPEESYAVLETLTGHAETILQRLELPYRVVNLCGGDLGFSAAKTYDIEVWLPGQNQYREISSCSNFEAFQARRMKARWRNPETNKPELLHTLNGSGVAVGRALVAVMENYQDQDGNIAIPKVLQPYMNGMRMIA